LPKLNNEQGQAVESWISDTEMKGSVVPLNQIKSWAVTNTQQFLWHLKKPLSSTPLLGRPAMMPSWNCVLYFH